MFTSVERAQLAEEEAEALESWEAGGEHSKKQRQARALAIEWAENGESMCCNVVYVILCNTYLLFHGVQYM
jgi:hypothetical protein